MPPQETTGTGARPSQPRVFGKYELVQRLGSGGMAEVWRARIKGPAGFSRGLVIKRILPHLAQDASFVNMFISEAQLSAKLSHPNVIQVFELGQVDGEYYIAMEYVRGHDLGALTRAHLERRGPLPPPVSAYVVREVCRALAYAHEFRDEDGNLVRLIHRDVSPSNVMLSNDGAIKLLDFGIAKALVESGDRTQTGTLKGKFAYMAPEQLEGNEFDHRADIFSAGIILHEILTGRRLFRGNNDLQTISLVKSAKVELPSLINQQIGSELDRITLKALARDADARYQSAIDMANDLDEVVHQLKGGSHLVAKLVGELFVAEAPGRSGVRLAAVAAEPDSQPVPPAPVAPPATGNSAGEAEGVATVVEISASFTGVPGALGPLPQRIAAPSPSSSAGAPAPSEPTGSLINLRPSLRRTLFIASIAAVGALAGMVVILWPRSTPLPEGPAPAPVVAAPAPVVIAPPAPRPLATADEQVSVTVSSLPVGAEVFLDGDSKPRGRTPLVLTLPRAKKSHGVKLVARGYTPSTSQFSASSDVQLTLSLVRLPAPKRPVAHVPRLPTNGDATHQLADPFDVKHSR